MGNFTNTSCNNKINENTWNNSKIKIKPEIFKINIIKKTREKKWNFRLWKNTYRQQLGLCLALSCGIMAVLFCVLGKMISIITLEMVVELFSPAVCSRNGNGESVASYHVFFHEFTPFLTPRHRSSFRCLFWIAATLSGWSLDFKERKGFRCENSLWGLLGF